MPAAGLMFNTYEETLDYLYQNLPMFQRVGASAIKPDLQNTLALCSKLGNPHLKFKSIHVAGTNGKGSTSHMLASILQSSGYKTGLYTSPHLKSFTERIRINGAEISKDYIVEFVKNIHPLIEKIKPSFFEITVAMAFDYFASEYVDVAVIEVGLGGRLDSTNVIIPELSVITNIGWDHTDILGNTLQQIASEKAGIIKKGIPVVISERQAEIDAVFKDKAVELDAPLYFAEDNFRANTSKSGEQVVFEIYGGSTRLFSNLQLQLQGLYQEKNIPGVLQSVTVLREKGWKISNEQLLDGLKYVVSHTGLKGRWQILGNHPLIVCDTGHNLNGIQEVLRQIKLQSFDKLFFVFGMVKGKDAKAILELLPKTAYYFFCEAKIPRALDAVALFEQAQNNGLKGEVIPDVNEAIEHAKKVAAPNDMIFIGGSTYVVAEIDNL
jgi:dihydrofolate synthase/folylpolyglutamate synthase